MWRGFDVTYVSNITDVEDKIIAAAEESGESVEDLAVRMAARFSTSFKRLGVLPPDIEPKATYHIPEMLDLIDLLIDRGLAYARDGDVYFSVKTLEGYGRLSGRNPDELRAGVRIEVDETKEDALDFALWKAAKPGEPTWDSPWGPGRPGWHIECSAMASKYLGEGFDIHGGGLDLVFPHHENEVAQTEAARGRPLARIWMHNGMVELDREKMSKSEGNIQLLGEALDRFGRDAVVMYFLGGHYRQPLAYSDELLDEARAGVQRIREALRRLTAGESPPDMAPLKERFFEALADDFNTPKALAAMFDWIREANRREGVGGAELHEMLDVLGFAELEPLDAVAEPAEVDPQAAELLRRRDRARRGRDFAEADRLRDEIRTRGWEVRDGPEGAELIPLDR
jgi:cysteinyl-tRNA synthetase